MALWYWLIYGNTHRQTNTHIDAEIHMHVHTYKSTLLTSASAATYWANKEYCTYDVLSGNQTAILLLGDCSSYKTFHIHT